MRLFNKFFFGVSKEETAELIRCNHDFKPEDFFKNETPDGTLGVCIITPTQTISSPFDGKAIPYGHKIQYIKLLERVFPGSNLSLSKSEAVYKIGRNILITIQKCKDNNLICVYLPKDKVINERQKQSCIGMLGKLKEPQLQDKSLIIAIELDDLEEYLNYINIPKEMSIDDLIKVLNGIQTQNVPPNIGEFDWSGYDFAGCITEEEFQRRALEYAKDLHAKIEAKRKPLQTAGPAVPTDYEER